MKNKFPILLLGDRGDWKAAYVYHRLRVAGVEVLFLRQPNPLSATLPPLCLSGNGECYAIAARTLGRELADWYWDLSRRSGQHLERVGATLVPIDWHVSEKRVDLLRESAATHDDWISEAVRGDETVFTQRGRYFEPFVQKLWADLDRPDSKSLTLSVENVELQTEGGFGVSATFLAAGRQVKIRSEIALVVSEWAAPRLFPWLRDKWIPVTLSTFSAPAIDLESTKHSIYSMGADHLFDTGEGRRLWSYRSLFEDSAVGAHSERNFRAEEGWRSLLRGRERSAARVELASEPVLEAISCDGLPIAGPLPFSPSIFVLGAFAGRANNFFVALADGWVENILKSNASDIIGPASIRRLFVG